VQTTSAWKFTDLKTFFRNVGPYLLLELILPGGTLFALLLYLYRRGKTRIDCNRASQLDRRITKALENILYEVSFAVQPYGLWAPVQSGRERDGLEALDMIPRR